MQKKTEQDIDIYTVAGDASGPTLTISGAVHGNEKAGPKAIMKVIECINNGSIQIVKGRLTLIPIANPKAYDLNTRFVDANLNRSMYPRSKDEIKSYEDNLRNVLCPVLEATDYLLDLHSCTAPSDPFVIVGGDMSNPDNIEYAKAIGARRLIWGWQEALIANDKVEDPRHSYGMTEYTREHGGLAITIECGNHDHPRGPDFAFQAILNVLRYTGIGQYEPSLNIDDVFQDDQICIRLKESVFKAEDGAFQDEWNNMHFIPAHTTIAAFHKGQAFSFDRDGYVVMPNKNAIIGHEWFYWGVEEEITT